ncbi:hypothetical protein [Janthinobacterium lividum]|uniref:hypothetical protein n=1 Tax=Janthinobacterium lividum TaxID=29581 RepID=UPI001595EF6A|nr:hypothetical protein [Janthinobacterium lividum]QKY11958.1 hypothetical protein G8765_29140 [Janthinobacterium lividum]
MSSTPGGRIAGGPKQLEVQHNQATRLIARKSCSTILLRDLIWRTTIGVFSQTCMSAIAALLVPLLAIAPLAEFLDFLFSQKSFCFWRARIVTVSYATCWLLVLLHLCSEDGLFYKFISFYQMITPLPARNIVGKRHSIDVTDRNE